MEIIQVKKDNQGMYLEQYGIRLTRFFDSITTAQNINSNFKNETIVSCNYKGKTSVICLVTNKTLVKSRKDISLIKMSDYLYAISYYKLSIRGRIRITKVVDNKGKKIFEFYNDTNKYYHFNDLMPLKINGKFGYINIKGDIVLEPKYLTASKFKKGNAVVRFLDGNITRCWLIDREGNNMLRDSKYNYITKFPNDFWFVLDTENWGKNLLDENQKLLLKGLYCNITVLNDKLIKVVDKKTGLAGVVDYKENVVVPLMFSMIYETKHKGYYYIMSKEGKCGIMDKDGNMIIDVKYSKKDIKETPDAFLLKVKTIKVIEKD